MKKLKLKKRVPKIILGICLLIVSSLFLSDYLISKQADNCYDSIDSIPAAKVGLLLGTSKYVKSGNINQYYQNRINAAVALYKAGKIKYILVSGDNSTIQYDEPNTFKKDLIKAGIPAQKIFLDHAGFRTLDSVVRAKEVFQENQFTIISQPFHNERAMYIAQQKNITAAAFNAKKVGEKYGFKTQLREKFARVKTLLDIYILRTKPKFLGPKITIG